MCAYVRACNQGKKTIPTRLLSACVRSFVRACVCTNKYLNIIIKVSMQIFLLISVCMYNN